MALSVKHNFVSAKSDGLDTTKVQPSNWNDGHVLLAAVDNVIGTDSGSTTVKELSCTAVGRAILACVDAAAQRAALRVMTVPIGMSFVWHVNTLPVVDSGIEVAWMAGQAISRTTYSELFALFGTTYGSGDGSTTFNLPNGAEVAMVGRATMGGAAGRGFTQHTSNNTVIGALIGEGTHQLTEGELPSHAHPNFLSDPAHSHGNFINDFTHSHTYGDNFFSAVHQAAPGGGQFAGSNALAGSTTASSIANISITNVASSTSISLTNGFSGSFVSHNNVQKCLNVNFVIRIK
ncbi:MAG: phage tail protein [Ktedonobacterales bacterium]